MADEATTIPTGIQLTVFDEVFRNHPHERFDALRGAEPVHHDKVFNRYVLTRASDVAAVLKDRRLSRDPKKAAPDSATALVLGEARDDPSRRSCFSMTPITNDCGVWLQRHSMPTPSNRCAAISPRLPMDCWIRLPINPNST